MGRGRPKLDAQEVKQRHSVYLTREEYDLLTRLGEKCGVTASQMIAVMARWFEEDYGGFQNLKEFVRADGDVDAKSEQEIRLMRDARVRANEEKWKTGRQVFRVPWHKFIYVRGCDCSWITDALRYDDSTWAIPAREIDHVVAGARVYSSLAMLVLDFPEQGVAKENLMKWCHRQKPLTGRDRRACAAFVALQKTGKA